jgi:hypothetical protein
MKNVDLYQFKDEKTQLWGCKFYKNHKIAISPQYGYAWPFNQYGIAVVRKATFISLRMKKPNCGGTSFTKIIKSPSVHNTDMLGLSTNTG